MYTVDLVLYREVVPTQRLTNKPHPSIPRLNLLRGAASGRSISDLCGHIHSETSTNRLQRARSTFAYVLVLSEVNPINEQEFPLV